jgi:hypothetical protein
MLLRGIAIGLHEMEEQLAMRLDVAVEVHADEAVELQEAGIDVAQEAGIWKRHLGNDVAAEPVEAALLRQRVHHCRVHPRIDRTTHQHHGMRDVRVVLSLHARDRGEHRHRRLADRNHVRVAAKEMQDRDQIVDVIVEIEAAVRQRHHARVDPLGEVDVMVGQKALDGAAQQCRIMPRHRRHDEEARLRPARRMLERTLEMQQAAEGPLPGDRDVHRDVATAHHGGVDIPLGLAVAPRRALEQFEARGHGLAELGVSPRVGRVLEEQPRGIGKGAGGIEGGLAHFVEPIRRRREHRASIARCGRRAAKFTNRHVPGL